MYVPSWIYWVYVRSLPIPTNRLIKRQTYNQTLAPVINSEHVLLPLNRFYANKILHIRSTLKETVRCYLLISDLSVSQGRMDEHTRYILFGSDWCCSNWLVFRCGCSQVCCSADCLLMLRLQGRKKLTNCTTFLASNSKPRDKIFGIMFFIFFIFRFQGKLRNLRNKQNSANSWCLTVECFKKQHPI